MAPAGAAGPVNANETGARFPGAGALAGSRTSGGATRRRAGSPAEQGSQR